MRVLIAVIWRLVLLAPVLQAQLPYHEPPTVLRTSDHCYLDWSGRSGMTYFIQGSPDLKTWTYLPYIGSGSDASLDYDFQYNGDKMFVRLKFTNIVTNDPNSDDFDGDGISNWDEVREGGSGTSPLEWDTRGDGRSDYFADRDGNAVADGWELKHFGSIGIIDPFADPDQDGYDHAAESYLDTNPNAHAGTNDEDGDGLVDAVDAVPDDRLINWPATPVVDYVYLELGDLAAMQKVKAVALSEAGHVLVEAWPDGMPINDVNKQYHVWQPLSGTWSGPLAKSYNGNHAAVIRATDVGSDGKIVGSALVEKDTVDSGGSPSVVSFHSRITWTDASSDPFPEAGDRFAVQQASHNPSALVIAPALAPDGQLLSMSRGAYPGNQPSLLTFGADTLEQWVVEHSDPPESHGVINRYGIPGAGNRVTMTRLHGYYDAEAEGTEYREAGAYLYQSGKRETVDATEWVAAHAVAAMPDQEQEPGKGRLAITGTYTWIKKDGIWQKTKRPVRGVEITSSGIIRTPASDSGHDIWMNGKYYLLEDRCPEILAHDYTSYFIKKINDGGVMLIQAAAHTGDKIGLALPVNTAVGAEEQYEGDDPAQSPSQTNQPASPDTEKPLESKLAWRSNFVPADKEDTEGGWLVVNFDDDDNDSGAWGHGQTNPKPDKDDMNGVTGENDLLNLGISRIPAKGVSYRIKYDDFYVKIWKKRSKGGQNELVVSEDTIFTIPENKKWLPLYVEGIEPHSDDAGTIITAQFKIGTNGEWKDADSVKVRVAYPIIAVFGDGGTWAADRGELFNYAKDLAGKNERRKRGSTFLVPGKSQQGKDVCYSITGLTGNGNPGQPSPVEKIIKIALAMRHTDIVFTGHCNYGVGLALGTNFNSFDQFFNTAGGGVASISLHHFGVGEHPLMAVRNNLLQWNTTAINDRNQRALSTPLNRHMQGQGILPNIHRYPQAAGVPQVAIGEKFPNKDEPWANSETSAGNIRWHYIAHPDLDGNGPDDKHTILNTGAADVPSTLRYRSLFLNQCNTYRSFAETFKHGTLISSWASVSSYELAAKYVQGIVEGWTWIKVEEELEKKDNSFDPTQDPTEVPRRAFEVSNFGQS